MLSKGIVLEVEREKITVLTNDQDYVHLKYKKGIEVGQMIYYTNADIYRKRTYKTWYSAVAALLLVLLIPSLFYFTPVFDSKSYAAAAIVSVDINPSIEFEIDKARKVIHVIALNKDAEPLIKKVWISEPYNKVLAEYLNNVKKQGYLAENSTVLISCSVLDTAVKEQEIKDITQDTINETAPKISISYVSGDKEIVHKAKKEKISIGKYKLYQEICANDPTITIKELEKKSIKELVHHVKEQRKISDAKNEKNKKNEKEKKQEINNKKANQKVKIKETKENGTDDQESVIENDSSDIDSNDSIQENQNIWNNDADNKDHNNYQKKQNKDKSKDKSNNKDDSNN